MPHTPLFRSKAFEDKSLRGVYGDVIEEIDWSVGRVLETLREEGLAENTLVLFTSDNGPWLIFGDHGGSAGLLREGKGSTWEGGMRVPALFWWPGRIQPGVVRQMGSTLDVLPTIAQLAGAPVPSDRPIDGYDLSEVLVGEGKSPREEMYFYREERLFAVRRGAFKAHFRTQAGYTEPRPTRHDPPLLFHLEHDPGERYDVAAEPPRSTRAAHAYGDRTQRELQAGRESVGSPGRRPGGCVSASAGEVALRGGAGEGFTPTTRVAIGTVRSVRPTPARTGLQGYKGIETTETRTGGESRDNSPSNAWRSSVRFGANRSRAPGPPSVPRSTRLDRSTGGPIAAGLTLTDKRRPTARPRAWRSA